MDVGEKIMFTQKLLNYIYIYIPGTFLSSILRLKRFKTRSFPSKTRVIWVPVPGVYMDVGKKSGFNDFGLFQIFRQWNLYTKEIKHGMKTHGFFHLQVGPMPSPFCHHPAMVSPWTFTLAVLSSELASRTVNGAQHWKHWTMPWRFLWRWVPGGLLPRLVEVYEFQWGKRPYRHVRGCWTSKDAHIHMLYMVKVAHGMGVEIALEIASTKELWLIFLTGKTPEIPTTPLRHMGGKRHRVQHCHKILG